MWLSLEKAAGAWGQRGETTALLFCLTFGDLKIKYMYSFFINKNFKDKNLCLFVFFVPIIVRWMALNDALTLRVSQY